jgi:hypothetical protein
VAPENIVLIPPLKDSRTGFDSAKRTAREIKDRAKDFNINPNLTRISTEGILKQLEKKIWLKVN